ncbi:MAG: 2-C-methyl-D-erythritol 2,4-cyclodiphosphate synthase [Bacteroidales bacterium]|nr:2-C-methyl-D-erythritol 2,4-cyclodiphosphate synthase [Bacteroidales bacterium]MBN2819422.1 2-C-methyl-D-erythritol 2,4-cyclodiphosphate synthase [Bacteroidales bacterium]
MNFRIGFGYDVHQLETGRKLILGGVILSHDKGPVAHSDGDVLIHAICDAILGAANLRDIGVHFPDNVEDYKGVDSKLLLKKTIGLLNESGYKVGNIDSTICLQRPKVKEYIPIMQEKLALVIGIPATNLSIKATTTETLGFVGREEGISAYAVVLIYRNN